MELWQLKVEQDREDALNKKLDESFGRSCREL